MSFDLELAGCVVAAVIMGWIADGEGHSAVAWGAITLALCLASLAIPLPIVRVLLAVVVTFLAMWAYNLVRLMRRQH
jgi:hypothetical protein